MELVSEYKEDMTNFIVNYLRIFQPPPNMPTMNLIMSEPLIIRESLYSAITINALALYDLIDFDDWLRTIIPAELRVEGPRYARLHDMLMSVQELFVDGLPC